MTEIINNNPDVFARYEHTKEEVAAVREIQRAQAVERLAKHQVRFGFTDRKVSNLTLVEKEAAIDDGPDEAILNNQDLLEIAAEYSRFHQPANERWQAANRGLGAEYQRGWSDGRAAAFEELLRMAAQPDLPRQITEESRLARLAGSEATIDPVTL